MGVVCTCHTFNNNFGMKHKFEKYLKEGCSKSSDEQFASDIFEIYCFCYNQNSQAVLVVTGINGINHQ